MESKEYKTNRGHLTLKKDELSILRKAVKEEYEKLGGERELEKSPQEIYDDLEGYFKAKLQQLGIKVFSVKKGRNEYLNGPGCFFLRNLFYAKRKDDEMKSHHYNFDFCYIFAFGVPRREHRAKKENKSKSANNTENQLKVVVSSLSIYASEMDKMKKYIETHFGHKVEKDIRDMRSSSVGSLINFHSSTIDSSIPIIYIIGKNHFFNETFVCDINHIRKKLKNPFLENACVVFLEDIWEGEYNINNSAGRIKINEFWHAQIKYMEDRTPSSSKPNLKAKGNKKEEDALENIEVSKKKTQLIIKDMSDLINFLLTETRTMSFTYFANHTSKEDFALLLSIKGVA